MNQPVYKQFEFDLGKNLFILVCLTYKLSSSLSLGSTIKQVKLKLNVFVNKLVNMMFNLII